MDPLVELKNEQARLRERQREITRQQSSVSNASWAFAALAFVPTLIPGTGVLGSLVLTSSYSVPSLALMARDGELTDELAQVNDKLISVTAELNTELEYQLLVDILNNIQDEEASEVVSNEIVTRHVDRVVKDTMRDINRQIESRDHRDHYDYVEPPDFDWGFDRDLDFGGPGSGTMLA
ncbi:MAG: hypothetical protein MI684_04285 [Chlorobiales bacterium]|nr:hypothetical protein [Chlorobiales bacterium]